jgi:NADPH:quinone reductase-like Zn-dependent oxidoreductase
MTQSMQVVLALPGGRLETAQRPIPSPARGQVLIKVHCSPVNPSDRMQIAGTYIQQRKLPFTPGLVGVGTVIDARKGGLMGRWVAGKRVVFAPGPALEGTWAQYALAPVEFCLPLAKDLSDSDGVNLLANATTVIGLLDRAGKAKTRSVVMTGAAGEVGRLFNVAARGRGLSVINVVYRQDQAKLLRGAGVEHVLVGGMDDFRAQLSTLAGKLGATVAFDAVAGDLTRDLLAALPDGSEVVVFGRLSGQDVTFDGLAYLSGRHMKLSGFDVNLWLGSQSKFAVISIAKKAAMLLRQGQGTRVQHRVSLSDLAIRFDDLQHDQTAGKTIVFPNG